MTIVNVLLIAAIFGYAGWTLYRHIRRSKEGKCANCSARKSCEAESCVPPIAKS